MCLKVVEKAKHKDIPIAEGEVCASFAVSPCDMSSPSDVPAHESHTSLPTEIWRHRWTGKTPTSVKKLNKLLTSAENT